MSKAALFALVLPFLMAPLPGTETLGTLPTAGSPLCPNLVPHEPIVLYEVVGSTLSGLVDRQLVVYRDGTARYSSSIDGADGSSRTTFVGSAAAQNLLANLALNGAASLCDQPLVVSDVPLSTLTLMRGSPKSTAFTASWWIPDGAFGPVTLLLEGFIASHFP